MKIKITSDCRFEGKSHKEDEILDVKDNLGNYLIGIGRAVKVVAKESPAKAKPSATDEAK